MCVKMAHLPLCKKANKIKDLDKKIKNIIFFDKMFKKYLTGNIYMV